MHLKCLASVHHSSTRFLYQKWKSNWQEPLVSLVRASRLHLRTRRVRGQRGEKEIWSVLDSWGDEYILGAIPSNKNSSSIISNQADKRFFNIFHKSNYLSSHLLRVRTAVHLPFLSRYTQKLVEVAIWRWLRHDDRIQHHIVIQVVTIINRRMAWMIDCFAVVEKPQSESHALLQRGVRIMIF